MPRRRKLSQTQQAITRRNLKRTNFPKWKSTVLRSSWLARAKRAGLSTTLVPSREAIEQWLIDQAPFVCYYTKEKLGYNFEADHRVPISRNGSLSLDNICLTSGLLNGAKGNLTELEFKQLLKVISKWEDSGKSLLQRLRRGHF